MIRKLLLLAVFCFPSFAAAQAEKPEIRVFHKTHCKVCLAVKKEVLPPVAEKYGDRVTWIYIDTEEKEDNLSLLIGYAEQYGKDSVVPSIAVGNRFLSGRKDIEANLVPAIEAALSGEGGGDVSGKSLAAVFSSMSLWAVIGSGLIDGINPCAFAVIVFFISFLTVYGYNRREILVVGMAYCMAVFGTYLLLGLGLFRVLYAMSGFYAVMKTFYYVVALLCFGLFAFSVYDFYIYRKTGQSEGLTLQIPKGLKLRINRIIGRLRGQESRSSLWRLFAAALVVGILVSLIEAVCTGQIYVPTIAFIMKDHALRAKAWAYLLLYNVMFIVPLLGVFALSLLGTESDRFNGFLKTHLATMKVLLALVFLSLGVLMLRS